MTHPDAWPPGTEVFQYQILDRRGTGGMGEVYRAHDRRLDRVVAIKVLQERFATDPRMRERFEREARAIAALAHPGIVSIFEMAMVRERICLVMEWLDGESLRERLDRGALPRREAIDIARQTADALDAAHAKGIVHRDLKPENIFLTTAGRVKVLDFGIAQWTPIHPTATHAPTAATTMPGQILGTPGYLAPEQLRGEEVTAQADVFGLGCVLLEMVTGRRAFQRASTADTLSAVLTAPPAGLRDLADRGETRLAHVVARALEKRLIHRYASAAALGDSLRGLAEPDADPRPLLPERPIRDHYDLIVIGSGPAGQRGAIAAAKIGKRVAVIDRAERLGGASVHTGTLPSKTLREGVLALNGAAARSPFARATAKQHFAAGDLTSRVATVIERERNLVFDHLARNGVDLVDGWASFRDPHTVQVPQPGGTVTLSGDRVLIACGSRPATSPDVPVDNARIFDVEGFQRLDDLPRHVIVVGAGVIGLEFASIVTALGTRVTIIDQRPTVLEFVDHEIVESLLYQLRRRGATLRLSEQVSAARPTASGVVVDLDTGRHVHADALLHSIGRRGNGDLLDLHHAGLTADARGRLSVDAQYRTAVPHIFAAGDVIGFPALASVSMEQGRLAAEHMFGAQRTRASTPLPYALYTLPEIAMIGTTEQDLTAAHVRYEVGVGRFEDLAKGQMLGDEVGFLKVLFDPDTLRILGIHVIGTGAAELIHIGQSVMALGGTLDYLRDAVFNHPSWAEAYKIAALNGYNRLHT